MDPAVKRKRKPREPKKSPCEGRIAVVEAKLDAHIDKTREKFAVIDQQIIAFNRVLHTLPQEFRKIATEHKDEIKRYIYEQVQPLGSSVRSGERRIRTLEEINDKRDGVTLTKEDFEDPQI